MDAQEAIKSAKIYIEELFRSDGAINIGLEELQFDDARSLWLVTIGFTRKWEGPQGHARWGLDGEPFPRTFKTVEIENSTGKILGVRHWPVAA